MNLRVHYSKWTNGTFAEARVFWRQDMCRPGRWIPPCFLKGVEALCHLRHSVRPDGRWAAGHCGRVGKGLARD
jgi:hypothetical protein